MNFNTFSGYIGGTGRNQIKSQTLAATTETEFAVNTDTSGTTAIALLALPSGVGIGGTNTPLGPDTNQALLVHTGREAIPLGAATPHLTSQSFDSGRPFLIRLAGLVTPASNAANTLTIKIYSGTSKSGTNICTTGALTGMESSTAAGSFLMETQLQWDSTSGICNGQFWYLLNGATPNYHVWAVNTAATGATTLANMKFCASAAWGNAVGGVIAISEFSINQL